MKKICTLQLLSLLFLTSLNAQQQTLSGTVTASSGNESLQGVTVSVKGTNEATLTDRKGNFLLTTRQKLPSTIVFSSSGFTSREIEVKEIKELAVTLEPAILQLNEIVVGVTRAPTRLIEAPTSIEMISTKQIINAPATSYYDIAGTLKGVDITTSSLMFKTISTRGFNGSGSQRVNQLVDGMDNQAPALNFFVGNFTGLTELDVENIELLPGASSALYGSGGMNGTILINSKNPFKHQGLSLQVKQGIMHVDKRQRNHAAPFSDYSMRWAKAFNNKWAFKIGVQYISAQDWLADDTGNYQRAGNFGKLIPGDRKTDPNYDGVNVYGDETSVDVRQFVGGIGLSYPPGPQRNAILQLANSMTDPTMVSRTGYNESDVIDPETKNIKLSGALHYKLTNNLEALVMGYWATGNTVYTGNNRYVFKNIKIGQYKAELKHRDWFLRAYTTQENAGEAYSATVATQYLNEAWKPSYDPAKPSDSWYPQYAGAYLQARMQGAPDATAHNAARGYADQGRPLPGSDQFKQLFDKVRSIPIPNGGLFKEKSQLWMTEAQYNFSNKIKFAEIIVGGNLKKYILDSDGTLFIDTIKPIRFSEIGAYAQVTKKLLHDFLTLSVSGRYDKNEDYKGHFTPRATALVKVAPDNNLRISYQTAYRFPGTQSKYIRLDVGDYILLGGLPWVMDYMHADKSPVHELDGQIPNPAPYNYQPLKPESVGSFEVGYRGLIGRKLLVDVYGYSARYQNFIGRNALFQPATGTIFSTVINSSTKVNTHGFGLGFDYLLPKSFTVFFNMYSDVISDLPQGFQSFFNTPKYRLNTGLANSGLGKNKRAGFNIVMRWQDAFMWDGELANGPVPAFTTVDAQVSYKFPKVKTMIKAGGTNIFNHYYLNGYGNPRIGGLYYVSFAYNVF